MASDDLVDRIETGAIALDDPALVAYLGHSLRRTLQINNPKWIDP